MRWSWPSHRGAAKEKDTPDDRVVSTPPLPYYAVIFTSLRTPGADGLGITVSYWRSEKDIARWREHVEHRVARERGKAEWYEGYFLRVAKVERAYRK